METRDSSYQEGSNEKHVPKFSKRAILAFLVMLLRPLVLFLAAGTWRWTMGWIYYGLMIFFTLGSRAIASIKNPDLLAERARWMQTENIQPGDRFLGLWVGMLGMLAIWIIAGLNKRFGWSPEVPLWLMLVGLAMVVLGYAFSSWAMVENRFFSAVVRIQKDRQQTVITTGPYRIVRHPGYAGGIVSSVGIPLMLGSWWALIPLAWLIAGLVLRTAREDQLLQQELDGYIRYAQRVRYRLMPDVW